MRYFSVVERSWVRRRITRRGSLARPEVEQVEFSPDGRFLVTCCEAGRVGPWDVLTGGPPTSDQEPEFMPGTRATFHPSGGWLAGTGEFGGLAIYDRNRHHTIRDPDWGGIVIGRACITPDGQYLISYALGAHRVGLRELNARLWHPNGRNPSLWSTALPQTIPGFGWDTGLAVLADSERFAVAEVERTNHGRLTVRAVRTGDILAAHPLPLKGTEVLDLVVAPDDGLVVAWSGRHLHLWSWRCPEAPVRIVPNEGRKHFTAAVFHPSGEYLAATSNDETVKVYETTTWKVARVYQWEIGRMRSVAFSRDGMLAAAGGDRGDVVVWDVDL